MIQRFGSDLNNMARGFLRQATDEIFQPGAARKRLSYRGAQSADWKPYVENEGE